jgi:hypothetical protein
MSEFKNRAIPFLKFGNRRGLACYQLQIPWIREFRDMFPNSFEYDPVNHFHFFIEPEMKT